MAFNFALRFSRAFSSHISNRLRGKTTWDSAQIILAHALVTKLGHECTPFNVVFPEIIMRRKIYEGVLYDDHDLVTSQLDSCEAFSYRPECCEVYRDAFRSISECHPPIIKDTLSGILSDAQMHDDFGSRIT